MRLLPRPARVHVAGQRYDVGLVDEVGNHEFNPPTLQAVSRRDAFLHDGRADRSKRYSGKSGIPGDSISPREIADLIAFLQTL